MIQDYQKILALIEYIKINQFYVSFHFRCPITKEIVVSTVPFEPYDGKIKFKWYEIVFFPIQSYKRYYHTPITIYSAKEEHTILLKAFDKVKKNFHWDNKEKIYILKK